MPETISIRGDADTLRDALLNVLENALLHGAGEVSLSCRKDAEQGLAVLCVGDAGPGFEPAMAGSAFERFQKGPRSAGSGLGLAIVRQVLRSHGGEATALPGPPGRIELTLPLADKTDPRLPVGMRVQSVSPPPAHRLPHRSEAGLDQKNAT